MQTGVVMKLGDEPVAFAAQAAARLGISVTTLWRCERAGEITALNMGVHRVFRLVDVDALIAKRALARAKRKTSPNQPTEHEP